jgi:nitrate reductase gamma subunit
MSTPAIPEAAEAQGELRLPVAAAALLFTFGLIGIVGPAWGYGLFLIATLFLLAGGLLLLIFLMTNAFDSMRLQRALGGAFTAGAWAYVLAVSALAGFFAQEAADGRIELKWMIFGPAALAAIVVLDWGLYRVLVQKNMPTWQRYHHVISRDRLEPAALRATFVDEVVLHRSLFRISAFRWLRHQLILWGFVLMFAVELSAVFIREGLPAFGLPDIWRVPGHPVRLAFDFAFDITGLMILTGCVLALLFRVRVQGTPQQKYTDTPSALFLLVVVLSGFLVEGIRIAGSLSQSHHAASPIGLLFAHAMGDPTSGSKAASDAIWTFHALAACAFIAYVPLKRLIHSCATPLGRLMNSQKAMLAAKKDRALRGLFTKRMDV